MWHFVDLNDEQKHERRHLLDLSGHIAQLSVLAPLAALQVYFLLGWALRRWTRGADADAGAVPGSPYVKKEMASRGFGLRRLEVGWRRLRWWAGGKVEVLGFEAVRGEVVFAGVWAAWLVLLCLVDTKGDYMHLTKRFGIVGASQLPFHYLLALKTPYSPLQALTRRSWESLNNLHQLLGRIVTLLFYLHAAFYLNFFIQFNVIGKRIKDRDVILGLTAIVAFTAIGTTALSWMRRWSYKLFFGVHVVLATVLLPVLYFHVSHIRPYIWETLGVYALHLVFRAINERTVMASVAFVPGTRDLLEIKVPLHSTSPRMARWYPGQHVYVALRKVSLFSRPISTKNPFTIASLPTRDRDLRLVARVLDGNTANLAAVVRSGKSGTFPLTIEGPYGVATHPQSLLGYSRVLFIAGGVGATFIMPLYRALLQDLSPSAGSRRRQNVRFVWAVREAAETNWAIPDDEREALGVKERMSVFVTRGTSSSIDRPRNLPRRADDTEQEPPPPFDNDDEDDGVELKQLLPSNNTYDADDDTNGPTPDTHAQGRANDKSAVSFDIGRPDIRALVDETFSGPMATNDKVAVFICGPKTLSRQVRKEVGRYIEKREVWFWNEEFGL